jgi:hypothetical protein
MCRLELLDLVVDAWSSNFARRSAPEAVVSALRTMIMTCSNGQHVRLEDTFLPTKALEDVAPSGMPFLPVANPEDGKWRALRQFGVVTDINSNSSSFWLACLRGLMKQATPLRTTVTDLYERLNKRDIGNSW